MPTLKQQTVAKILSENLGKPLGEAMLEAGYSKSTSETPQNLTQTNGWQELMEKHMPDSKLQQVIEEGLEANRIISAVNTGKQASGATADFVEVPDHAVRHKFVETALKLKDKFPETKSKIQIEDVTKLIQNDKQYIESQVQALGGEVSPEQVGSEV